MSLLHRNTLQELWGNISYVLEVPVYVRWNLGLKRIKGSILSNSTLQSSFSILLSNDNLIFCLSNVAFTRFSMFLRRGHLGKQSRHMYFRHFTGCNHCLWVSETMWFLPWNSLHRYKSILLTQQGFFSAHQLSPLMHSIGVECSRMPRYCSRCGGCTAPALPQLLV